jgi:hypothetical protein
MSRFELRLSVVRRVATWDRHLPPANTVTSQERNCLRNGQVFIPRWGQGFVVRFQVLTAASMEFRMFWDVLPCSQVDVDQHTPCRENLKAHLVNLYVEASLRCIRRSASSWLHGSTSQKTTLQGFVVCHNLYRHIFPEDKAAGAWG